MLTTDEAAAFTLTNDRRGDLRLRALLHPTERPRFALARAMPEAFMQPSVGTVLGF